MSVKNLQLMKWSFPALALIIGFFWYKRRGVDRVDPGGISKSDKKSLTTTTTTSTAKESNGEINTPKNNNLSLYDSGIHVEDSFSSINTLSQVSLKESVVICSPRKVSESLDIPMKKSDSMSMSMSMRSRKSSGNSLPWYEDVEDLPEMKGIVLGSNPKSSNFDLMIRKKPPVILENIEDNNNTSSEVISEQVIVSKVTSVVEQEQVENKILEKEGKIEVEVEELEQTVVATPQMRSRSISIETCDKTNDTVSTTDEGKTGQALSERDSANHSPVSGVLDGSVNDDIRSEGSTDSGKGGSINGKVSKTNDKIFYEFIIPEKYVGKLIGRQGYSIKNLNDQANVNIAIDFHPTEEDMRLCIIEGLSENITRALDLIRQKFPKKTYSDLSFEQVNITTSPEEITWVPELMQLQLVEGLNNDVLVCHILQPNRLFIQLPTHPTYPTLRLLDYNMTQFYSTVESPHVPDQLTRGMIVVAHWYEKWVRAFVEEPDAEGLKHVVRLVDHGGFWEFSSSEMRQITSEFLTLPFQTLEVNIAHVKPVAGEWSKDAYDVVAHLCSNCISQAQIEGYLDTEVFISLYITLPKYGVISLADELIARGYAESVSFEDLVTEQ
ncbi:KH domain-containing protein akap-1 isoform X1 [Microplitis mediator]|nr:KH domain-containing protein akap-1 isoform X1 [Microplitis mediator]XP_057325576.1 KH domain-containing protein akap-1 isoform X1 [Microplitis mediator]